MKCPVLNPCYVSVLWNFQLEQNFASMGGIIISKEEKPMEHTRAKTVRKSYSVPEELALLLEKEAEHRDTSSSTLLTQMMKKGLAFDLPLSKIGLVAIPSPCFQAMIEKMRLEELEEVAREQALRNFGILLSTFHGKPDLFSIISTYYERFSKYSGWYTFKHEIDEENHRFVFEHTRGLKWSRYLAEYNHVILDKLSDKMDCQIDNNLVIFNIVPRQKRATISYRHY
jgi:hypothetical protein